MNWPRLIIWILVPLATAALSAMGAKRLKTKKPKGRRGRVNRAVESGNLSAMVAAARIPAPAEERHRLLSTIVDRTYKDRKKKESRETFLRYARIHVDEYDFLKKSAEDLTPAMQTHKMLAIVLEEDKRYEEAIVLCKKALDLDLKDGTKTGYSGRIERLEKKAGRQ